MSFISYPRTAAEIRATLSLGYKEVIKLLRSNKLRVNLYSFLRHLFKENQYDNEAIDSLNNKLFEWSEKRKQEGLPCSAMAYHKTGVRLLKGFDIRMVCYERKADRAAYQKERDSDFKRISKNWIKEIAKNNTTELLNAGIPQSEIDKMLRTGCRPEMNGKGYQVHHRLPLDDGGTNDTKNFILIRDDVEHRAIHGYYNPAEIRIKSLGYGEKARVALVVPPKDTIVYPNPAMNYVADIIPNADFLDIYHAD